MEVYHYTNKKGLKAIQDSGYIKESRWNDTDAVFGEGVYLTTMGPEHGRAKIAENNYDGIWQNMEDEGRVDCAIKLTIPKEKLDEKTSSGRDVWVYKGKLYLNKYKHEIISL